jgi:predicted XRE-type DNA-binding protein
MIKNDKQYKITKKRLKELNDKLEPYHKKTLQPKDELIVNSLTRQKNQFKVEIKKYENLKNKSLSIFKLRNLDMLPHVLIEYKISKGFSQKEFAKVLGIKEQQLQRYESDDFRSVSFSKLLNFIELAGITIQVKGNRISERV